MIFDTLKESVILTNRVHCLLGFPGQTKPIRKMFFHLTIDGFWVVNKKLKLFIPHNKITSFETTKQNLFGLIKNDYLNQLRTGVEITYITDDGSSNSIYLQFFVSIPVSLAKNDAALKVMIAEMQRHDIFNKFIPRPQPDTSVNTIMQIEKLAELYKSGVLSSEEFQNKKADLLKLL